MKQSHPPDGDDSPWWPFFELRRYLLTALSSITAVLFAQVIYLACKVDRHFVIVFGMFSTFWALLFFGPRLNRILCKVARIGEPRRRA